MTNSLSQPSSQKTDDHYFHRLSAKFHDMIATWFKGSLSKKLWILKCMIFFFFFFFFFFNRKSYIYIKKYPFVFLLYLFDLIHFSVSWSTLNWKGHTKNLDIFSRIMSFSQTTNIDKNRVQIVLCQSHYCKLLLPLTIVQYILTKPGL